jgi:hypothetical protein
VYERLKEIENKTTIKWDNKSRRYINKEGDFFTNIDKEMEEFVLWLKEN